MMEPIPLYYSKSKRSYFYVGVPICKLCERPQYSEIIIRIFWRKKDSERNLYCINCFKKVRSIDNVQEIRGAKVVGVPPKDAFIVLDRPPTLVSGNVETVFSMAEKNVDGEAVTDLTKLSYKESWEGASIGSEVHDEEKDRVLSDDEAEHFLLDALNSKPFSDANALGVEKKGEVNESDKRNRCRKLGLSERGNERENS